MSKNSLALGVCVSAAILAAGVFLPLTQLPVYGDVSYHDIAKMESWLVVASAGAGIVLLALGMKRLLILAPLAAWLTLLFPAIKSRLQLEDEGLLSSIGNKVSSVMQEFAVDLFLNIVEFSWGGFVFLAGLLAFTLSCVMRSLK